MYENEMDYNERPRMRIIQKGVELLTYANDSIRAIADDMVISAVLLDSVHPVMRRGGSALERKIKPKTKTAFDVLEDSLWTMEALLALEDNEDGVLLLLYPDSVKEALTNAIPFLVEGIAEMKSTIKSYDKVIDEAEPESGEGYVEGYIVMRLEDKVKEFEEAILSIKRALDIFI
jgi:hypothetical protein